MFDFLTVLPFQKIDKKVTIDASQWVYQLIIFPFFFS